MKIDDLIDAIGDIDDSYLEKYTPQLRRKSHIPWGLISAAACFCLLICTVVILRSVGVLPSVPEPLSTAPTETTEPQSTDIGYVSLLPQPVPSEVEQSVTVQVVPRKVDNPENLPVLKWVVLNGGFRNWAEEPVEELNQMLADRSMSFRLQFVVISAPFSLYGYDCNFLSLPVVQDAIKDADLITGSMTAAQRLEYLSPITQYVTGDAQLSLAGAALHELNWAGLTTDGEIYGIPTEYTWATNNGWWLDPDMLDVWGITQEDLKKDYWEMDELFARIYQANGNRPFLYCPNGRMETGTLRYETVNSVYSSLGRYLTNRYQNDVGAIYSIKLTNGRPEVVHPLEDEEGKKILEAVNRYQAAGYTTTESKYGVLYYGTVDSAEPYVNEYGRLYIPVTPLVYNSGYSYCQVTGITAVSRKKQAAVQLLNLMIEDREFQYQLFYGKEGRDYVIDDDGVFTVCNHQNGKSYGMLGLSMLSIYNLKNDFGTAKWDSTRNWKVDQSGKTMLQYYQDEMNAVRYISCPVSFDLTHFEKELRKIEVVVNRYYDIMDKDWNGQSYSRMVDALEDAGSKKVLAALRAQLEGWLLEHPDWTAEVQP